MAPILLLIYSGPIQYLAIAFRIKVIQARL